MRLPDVDVIARVPLAPVLAVQAVSVRHRARVLPEPPGRRAGTVGAGPPLRLLIVGDSSAAGVGADTQEAALSGNLAAALAPRFRLSWRLEAATGATTADAIARLHRVTPEQFDVAVVVLGVNDVTHATSRRNWGIRRTALHGLLETRFGVRRIIASGVPPMGQFPLLPHPLRWVLGRQAARFDADLAAMARGQSNLIHVPMDMPHDPRFVAEDGFHPSPDAYAEWARLLAGVIPDP